MKFINYYQEGGAMAPEGAPMEGAPAEMGGGEDPGAMLMQGASQALETQDCNVAMQVCQMVLELMGGGAEGGEPMPEEAAPAPEGEPVYRRGGVLLRRI